MSDLEKPNPLRIILHLIANSMEAEADLCRQIEEVLPQGRARALLKYHQQRLANIHRTIDEVLKRG